MKTFNDLSLAINWVETQTKFKPKENLDHMRKAFELLNLDFSNVKKIHVTGTNGKGSVCMFLTKILVDQSLKVGTFTSPYLIDFNERIKLNNENIRNDDLLSLINFIYEHNQNYLKLTGETLSFFELLTLAAFKYFDQENVDVMIIEVGIGGLLDATNIINYDASVITNVGFDHMRQLGNTKESIANNKLGIVKKDNYLFTTVDGSLHKQFNDYVNKIGASILIIYSKDIIVKSYNPYIIKYKDYDYHLSLIGNYQKTNAALAIEVAKYLYPNISDNNLSDSLSKTVYGGRLEEVLPAVYIDAAHNTHAINSLIDNINTIFKNYKVNVLFSALSDKEPQAMLELLKSHVNSIIMTSFPDPRYQPLNDLPFDYIENPKDALNYLIDNKKEREIIIITGSLHFIGYMKKTILKKEY